MLQAVNLRSSKILEHQSIQTYNEGRHAALSEILEILTVVCESQKLPLAQTWIPCQHGPVLAQHDGSKKSFSTSDGSCMGQVCMSTSDAAFYVVDARMWGFRDACSEHHLQKGQGVVGRAFAVKRHCFCSDITQFCKTEYPLVHYAQMFGLVSCLALYLRNSHSEDDVYVAEFFLPSDCKDPIRQYVLLESISTMVKQSFRSLKVITGAEVEGQPFEMVDMITHANHEIQHIQYTLPKIVTLEGLDEDENRTLTENGSISSSANKINKATGRKRGKAERTISLEVLQQYFSGSLKDAAKSLGVCPTTMKRICRQHGISRWPSRKINKVNRSISQLKQVIKSVQVAEVALNLNPLVCPFPVAPCPVPLPVHPDKDSVARDVGLSTSHCKTLEGDGAHLQPPSEEPVGGHGHTSSSSRTSSSEGIMKTPVSQEQNDASLAHEACGIEQPFSTNSKELVTMINPSEDQNPAPLSSPTDVVVEPEHAAADMLAEDSASSKSARNPPSASTAIPEPKTVIIKARYKDDVIRFRIATDAAIAALNEEIGKRLMLEVGAFDVKYLDDDHDWVKLSCDEDLQECLEISATSGASVIRLSVQDICARATTNAPPEACVL